MIAAGGEERRTGAAARRVKSQCLAIKTFRPGEIADTQMNVPDPQAFGCPGVVADARIGERDEIVDIERDSGQVIATIDAAGLLTTEEIRTRSPDDVLNGIAYDPESNSFLITGKRWPRLYQVRFVPAAG